MKCYAGAGGDGVPLSLSNPLSELVRRQELELCVLRERVRALEQSVGEPLTFSAIDAWEREVLEAAGREPAPPWADGALLRAAKLMRAGATAYVSLQCLRDREAQAREDQDPPPPPRSSAVLGIALCATAAAACALLLGWFLARSP